MLAHMDNDQCDFDAFDRYDAQWEKESFISHGDRFEEDFEEEL